jgi:chromosome partitioning protein
MPRILAIANRKGGVGKTTTAVNIATAMAAAGKKVLIVDLDPQGNASTSMGIDKKGASVSSYEVLLGIKKLTDAVVWTDVPNFSMIPSSANLAAAEIELVSMPNREFALKNALQKEAVNYDYILIDCPPSLSLITVNALVAADGVIVPLQCEFLALEGIADLIKNINIIKKNFNPKLMLHGVVLTMYDKRNNLTQMVEDDVRNFFGKKVYDTVIPRNVKISEAPSHGKPVIVHDIDCAGSKAYINLAKEVIKRNNIVIK